MPRSILLVLAVVPLVAFSGLISCSGDSSTDPGVPVVTMAGNLDFPSGSDVDLQDITIGFGDYDQAVDAEGAFAINGNEGLPGLAVAYDSESIPVLMCTVADPREGKEFTLDVHSTALSIAFLTPFVCDPDNAAEAMARLESLPEFETFEDWLEEALAVDYQTLGFENPDLDGALDDVVTAYMAGILEDLEAGPASPGSPADNGDNKEQIYVSPLSIVSGHQIVHKEADKFDISNWYGRWAICVTPTEEFFLFPNGTLLDFLKGKPWAPSHREFSLDLVVGEDPKAVLAYGLGFNSEPDNVFSNLTSEEQFRVVRAGASTVLFEFMPRLISVVTNSSKSFGKGDIANKKWVRIMSLAFKASRVTQRSIVYIQERKFWSFAWFLTKEMLKKMANDPEFATAYAEAMGTEFTGGALKKMGAMSHPIVHGIILGDASTSLLKTWFGFWDSRYKAEFKIWKEIDLEFGAITGIVVDKESGERLEGVTVDLQGDDDNPLNPSHREVTDAAGGYYFENITTGAKTLVASKSGYRTKSVEVTVADDATVEAPIIELEEITGSGQGKVIDEIYFEHGIDPPLFRKECNLDVAEIGGEGKTYAFWVYDGLYTLDLPEGRYTVKAIHEDYHPDEIEVTVDAEGNMEVPDDLILTPKSTITGEIYIDWDNDGSYETRYDFEAEDKMGAMMWQADWECVKGGDPDHVMAILGRDLVGDEWQIMQILFDTTRVKDPDLYDLGLLEDVGCGEADGLAHFITNRIVCTHHTWGDFPMFFKTSARLPECNCGITGAALGTAHFTDVGTELTDLIAGSIRNAGLAGWKTCHCYCCEDLDGDGNEDDWVVDCAPAIVNMDFRVLMGSFYEDTSLGPEAALSTPRAGGR